MNKKYVEHAEPVPNAIVAYNENGEKVYLVIHETDADEHNSRTADKFIVRLTPGQRDRLKARAKVDHQSMNDAVVMAIDKHLHQSEAFDELLRILEQAIKSQDTP